MEIGTHDYGQAADAALYLLEVLTVPSAWGPGGTWTESHEYTDRDQAIVQAVALTGGGIGARIRDRLTGAIIWPAETE